MERGGQKFLFDTLLEKIGNGPFSIFSFKNWFRMNDFEIVSLFKMAQNHSCITKKIKKSGTHTSHTMGNLLTEFKLCNSKTH